VSGTLCILLVSEDDALRALVAGALRSHRRAVLMARNGAEAMSVLDVARVDVMVVDLTAPIDAATSILADRAERPDVAIIPLVILSSTAPDRSVIDSPWTEVVAKPVVVDQLAAAIERVARTVR
jgi:DNA-binding response OmpR family regulator